MSAARSPQVERPDHAAALSFDQRPATRLQSGLALLEEPQAGADHVGRVRVAACLDLGGYEGVEVVPEDERGVLGMPGLRP